MSTAQSSSNGNIAFNVANVLPAGSRAIFGWLLRPLGNYLDARWPIRPEGEFDNRPWWLRNLPNLISIVRLLVGPILAYRLLRCNDEKERRRLMKLAVVTIASDGIDGELARMLNIVSDIGKLLDRLADKVLFFCLLIAAIWRQKRWSLTLPGIILVAIELAIVRTSDQITEEVARTGQHLEGSSPWGKLKFGCECLALVHPQHDDSPDQRRMTSLYLIVAIPLAYKSLRGYRRELAALRATASVTTT